MHTNKTDALEPDRIRILSLNVGLLDIRLLGRSFYRPADFVEQRLRAIPTQLQAFDADIVAMQELFQYRHIRWLTGKLADTYPYQYYQRTLRPVGNGLLLLSKRPLHSPRFQYFSKGLFKEQLIAGKGMLSAQVEIGGSAVTLVNLHTTAGGSSEEQGVPQILSLREAQLAQMLDDVQRRNSPLSLVVGDFNAGPEIAEPNYDYMLEQGYRDGYLDFCRQHDRLPEMTWDADNPLNRQGTHATSVSQRIDHFFLSDALNSRSRITDAGLAFTDSVVDTGIAAEPQNVTISDHFGLYLDLGVCAVESNPTANA